MADSCADVDSCSDAGHAFATQWHITRGRLGGRAIKRDDHGNVRRIGTFTEPDYLLPKEHRKENWYHEFGVSVDDVLTEIRKLESQGKRNLPQAKPFKRLLFLFNEEHTEKQLEAVVQKFCSKYGVRAINGAAHRDEGHMKLVKNLENGKSELIPSYNYHYHLLFTTQKIGLNRQVRIGGRQETHEMQDWFANELDMNRGVGKYEFIKDKQGEPVLDKHGKKQYLNKSQKRKNDQKFRRERMAEANKNLLVDLQQLLTENAGLREVIESDKQTKKNLAVINNEMRSQLQELGIASKEDYAELKKIKDTFSKEKPLIEILREQYNYINNLHSKTLQESDTEDIIDELDKRPLSSEHQSNLLKLANKVFQKALTLYDFIKDKLSANGLDEQSAKNFALDSDFQERYLKEWEKFISIKPILKKTSYRNEKVNLKQALSKIIDQPINRGKKR